MYEGYFHLQKRPFAATPDPTCFFAPEPIQEAIDELILRTESGQGIGLLMGPAGTGKTLVCRHITSELAGRFTPVFLANVNVPTRRALLQSILYELGRRYNRMEEQELRLAVYRALKDLALQGRAAVLIVDEAHLLSDRLLEELRMLASLAEQDEPLARLILAGQLSLEERLIDPSLEALNQRVVCQRYLEPLTHAQSIDYIRYRLGWAGGGDSEIFSPEALDLIAGASSGLPRCLNHLCDQALLLACAHDVRRVSADLVDEALLHLKRLPLPWNTRLTDDMAETAVDPSLAETENGSSWLESDGARDDENETSEPAAIEIGGQVDEEAGCEEEGLQPVAESRGHGMPWIEHETHTKDGAWISSGVVPLSEPAEPALRGFVEELVADRYATLDRIAPRIYRTFDDALVPESLRMARSESIPDAPQPRSQEDRPAHDELAQDQPAATAPDAAVDQMLALIDEVQSSEAIEPEPAVASVAAVPELQTEASWNDVVEPECESLEDDLGSKVLDACLEVQAAVNRWDEGHPAGVDVQAQTGAAEDSPDDLEIGYDIIEPEAGSRHAPPSYAVDGAGDHDLPQRYVPKPKYRHVFSTLRRRLGLRRGM